MGRSLITQVGVGILLPTGEEDENDLPPNFNTMLDRYVEESEDYENRDDVDLGDFYDALIEKNHPLLELEFGGVSEYYSDYSVMAKSSISTIWGSSGAIDPAKFSISNDEFDQLAGLVMSFGYEKVNPQIIVAASYG